MGRQWVSSSGGSSVIIVDWSSQVTRLMTPMARADARWNSFEVRARRVGIPNLETSAVHGRTRSLHGRRPRPDGTADRDTRTAGQSPSDVWSLSRSQSQLSLLTQRDQTQTVSVTETQSPVHVPRYCSTFRACQSSERRDFARQTERQTAATDMDVRRDESQYCRRNAVLRSR